MHKLYRMKSKGYNKIHVRIVNDEPRGVVCRIGIANVGDADLRHWV